MIGPVGTVNKPHSWPPKNTRVPDQLFRMARMVSWIL